jgi:hypothetical protein
MRNHLDTLYNDAAKVGYSGCVDKALVELGDELVHQVVRE